MSLLWRCVWRTSQRSAIKDMKWRDGDRIKWARYIYTERNLFFSNKLLGTKWHWLLYDSNINTHQKRNYKQSISSTKVQNISVKTFPPWKELRSHGDKELFTSRPWCQRGSVTQPTYFRFRYLHTGATDNVLLNKGRKLKNLIHKCLDSEPQLSEPTNQLFVIHIQTENETHVN